MTNQNSAADFIALTAILGLAISGSINFNQHQEVKRLSALSEAQSILIDAMERAMLMGRCFSPREGIKFVATSGMDWG